MSETLQTVYPEPVVGVCSIHPEIDAEILCEVCGDFLCGACVLPHHGIHFCPPCFERWRNGHAVLAVEEGDAGGTGTVILALSGLMLVPFILLHAKVGVLIWLGCILLGLSSLGSARGLEQLVVEGKRGEMGRLMARIGRVLAVLTITSACIALMVVWVIPKPPAVP